MFDSQKNQTNEKLKKFNKLNDASKDAAVRKAFGSLLFSGDDNDEIEPDQEENNSDESFDGERSRSRNFNLFLSDNERAIDEKEKATNEQIDNARVMFMGLHFGMQPKFGMSESLVIRKTLTPEENAPSTTAEQQTNNKPESELEALLNKSSSNRQLKNKDARNEDPTPFLLRYAAAAMVNYQLN